MNFFIINNLNFFKITFFHYFRYVPAWNCCRCCYGWVDCYYDPCGSDIAGGLSGNYLTGYNFFADFDPGCGSQPCCCFDNYNCVRFCCRWNCFAGCYSCYSGYNYSSVGTAPLNYFPGSAFVGNPDHCLFDDCFGVACCSWCYFAGMSCYNSAGHSVPWDSRKDWSFAGIPGYCKTDSHSGEAFDYSAEASVYCSAGSCCYSFAAGFDWTEASGYCFAVCCFEVAADYSADCSFVGAGCYSAGNYSEDCYSAAGTGHHDYQVDFAEACWYSVD